MPTVPAIFMRQIIRLLFSFKRAALSCCLLFALLGAADGAAQEDRTGYENALEQRAEWAIASLLGPGKAKVMVRVEAEPQAGARDAGASAEGASAPAGRLTVFIAVNDSVTDADAQKARDTISGLLGIAPARGDEVLILKTGFAPGREVPGRSGGLGKYASQILLVLAGLVAGFIFSRLTRPVADVKSSPAARAPIRQAPREQYVPPPAQPQPSTPDNNELNIPSRSGFYKRRE